MFNRIGLALAVVVKALLIASIAPAADMADHIAAIRAVQAEGRGNQEASRAWKELARSKATEIPKILAGFDGANPLAVNYLRSAVETIAQRELERGGHLPAGELEKFIVDTRQHQRARRLAFELLVAVDPAVPDRLIPTLLNDPNPEFRRDAVARLIDQARKDLAAEEKEKAHAEFSRALAAARDDDQVQVLKKHLEGLGEKVDLQRHFGFVTKWRLVAPFDNSGQKGLAAVYPPETEIVGGFSKEYTGKGDQKVAWVEHATESEYGVVDLAKALGPFKGAVAYAFAEFESDDPLAVDFRLGTPNSWKLWLNGELVFGREEYHRGMSLDQYKMQGRLKRGRNTILLKVCQNEQTEDWAQSWQFQLRVCDSTGTAILSAERKRESPTASGAGGG